MAIRKVARLGNPILREKSRNLTAEEIHSPWIRSLLQDLRDTQAEHAGIGISAPQIHQAVRVAIVEFARDNARYPGMGSLPLTVFINPTVSVLDPSMQTFWEGCLSVPGLRGRVSRPRKVRIDYLDEQGESRSLVAEDFLAAVLQHELDHLDGILFVDRVVTHPGATPLSFVEEYRQFQVSADLDEVE